MRRYLALARLPNGPRLLAGSVLAAPGQAALDLAILLALRHATGSFGPGGVAVGAGTVGFSISAILQGRLIDRLGIPRVLAAAALASASATAALAAAIALGAEPAVLVTLSALIGLSQPAISPAVRTAWTITAPDATIRTTAFSYCSVTQDLGFVVGPALLGLVATAATPVISLLCCGTLTTLGALAISSAAATMRPPGRVIAARGRGLLRSVAPVATVLIAVGAALGLVDVCAPAVATLHGQPNLAGVLVAASATGSVLGGLVYGARSWNLPAAHRLLACATAMGALLVIPALTPEPVAVAGLLLIAGAPMGATLTTAYLLGGDRMPGDRTTAGFSLLTLALNAGGAAGYALGGQLAAHHSTADGFLFAAGASALAAIAAGVLVLAGPPRARGS